ncbi:hypothetical protein BDV35DRAFT_256481 [Aspergillus flavus]|uniref:Unnamed protein product n=3 Tax=Aspergillus subgen. Circumdati TaxID=2720871 RepID=A0AAN4YMV6_ASPOZ|nr:hypothetical protein BDV35DRAFT_256481 [Aspergillus flavus]GMG01536.1 unnamed protein product [Aspergillus oryzae]GMG31101.1 unnamed protein product [Aspergillus oryzae]GMG42482.1 unnamed protein product [Aspergillus oryzae var. brunneus]
MPLGAGKPHNLVCSGCRYPGNLLLCETCCRSYHGSCLPSQDASLLTGSFHCPSCRHKRWDQSPPQFDRSAPSSNASRGSTPGVNGYSRVTSSREYASIDGRRTLTALGPLAGPTQVLSIRSPPDVDRHQSSEDHGNFATPETDVLSRARNLLVDYGQLDADKDIRPELLLKLASMMTELEAQQSLQQEVQELKAENVALRNENANFRGYFTSRLPTNEPMINSSSNIIPPIFPRPSSDTSGKTWDRIVMDLI